jgi:hypothetical protein
MCWPLDTSGFTTLGGLALRFAARLVCPAAGPWFAGRLTSLQEVCQVSPSMQLDVTLRGGACWLAPAHLLLCSLQV